MKRKRNLKKQKAVFGSIRGKLAVSYLIPIVLIVALGIISYRRAAGTIIANYEVSMETAIRKTSEYYELMMDTIAVNCNQIAINNTLRAYYRGAYRGEPLQEKKNFLEMQKNMFMDAFSSDFVQGIYTFGEYGKECVSYLDVKKLEYGSYDGTEEGKEMAQAGERGIFSGCHGDLDAITGHTSGSQDGDLTAFASMDVYRKFLEGAEENSSFYMDHEGERYLFLFSKVGETGFAVCTMIPQALITESLKGIQTATVVIVLLALVISVCTGAVISTGINSSIKRISKVMKSVAEGDLTVTVQTKKTVSGHLFHMFRR